MQIMSVSGDMQAVEEVKHCFIKQEIRVVAGAEGVVGIWVALWGNFKMINDGVWAILRNRPFFMLKF